MFKLNGEPLFIHVTPDRWDSYGPRTWRSKFLFEVLKNTGGVSDSTPPGWYDFNVKITRLFRVETSLTPHEE